MNYLASDFDGTLYFDGIGIKEEDKKAIKKFRSEGNHFGICSGRPYYAMNKFLDGIECDFYVQNNGAHILDKDGNELYCKSISAETVNLILENGKNFMIILFGKKGVYINQDISYPNVSKIEDYYKNGDEILSFSVKFRTKEEAHKFTEEIARLEDIDTFQNEAAVDACPKGVSKANGLKKYCEVKGISGMSCIGDSYNDIPMFDAFEKSFTLNTSDEEVKKHARYTVEGISEAIAILER